MSKIFITGVLNEFGVAFRRGYFLSFLKYTGILLKKKFHRSPAVLDSHANGSTLVLSYPRSGNHAVRHAIELITKRPTLGAHAEFCRPTNEKHSFDLLGHFFDPPLLVREGSLSFFQSLKASAVKRHVPPRPKKQMWIL